MGSTDVGQALHTGAGCVSVPSYVWHRARGANTRLHAGAGDVSIPRRFAAVVEATPTPVPVSNPYGELGSKRGRPKDSTNKATERKPGPNAWTLAAKATSASRKITSMFERIVLLRLARQAAARYRRVPMDQSRGWGVTHTAAAAAVVEQEIVRVVRAAAVDPRDQTAHHNQARPLELNSKGKLTSLIIFEGLSNAKKS